MPDFEIVLDTRHMVVHFRYPIVHLLTSLLVRVKGKS